MSLPRIFVNIASYRDTECQWTLKDMFAKARHPERIFAGVVWQFVPDEDQACFVEPLPRPEQCRVLEFHAGEGLGVCWARAKAHSLWRGEDYTLQIDSHMRFVKDWDEVAIDLLAQCSSERAVLSTYPPAYTPPDDLAEPTYTVMFAREFEPRGTLKLHSRSIAFKEAPAKPEINPFCAGGFLFGPGQIIADVPYDPYLYFLGEEITLAVRLWTHGWDIFSPTKAVVWHDYTDRKGRRRHWHDHEAWTKQQERALKRINHLLGHTPSTDPEALKDIDRYGLGTRRSLADYEAFAKLSFAKLLIDGKDPDRIEAELPPNDRRQRIRETFAGIHRSNGWGAKETRSGDGSTLARTETIRAELPKLFDKLGIRILADAGCGDLNWIRDISKGLRFYIGIDVVPELIDDLRKRFAERLNHSFSLADVTIDVLPEADAILCRDVLTHLPHRMAIEALIRFKQSGARYLIATTHQRGTNEPLKIGGWQPTDLTAAPFSLPAPEISISEHLAGATKALGVWRLPDLVLPKL